MCCAFKNCKRHDQKGEDTAAQYEAQSDPVRDRVDEETAAQQIPNEAERRLALPYLRIKSSSSDQQFLLFIQQRPEVHQQTGDFNSYGLSSTATIPWF